MHGTINNFGRFFLIVLLGLGLNACTVGHHTDDSVRPASGTPQLVDLSDAEIENIVRRSYQYVAMYNVNNKGAMDPNNPSSPGGWNKLKAITKLFDHHVKMIARPNNDTFYAVGMLDLTREPMILEAPAIDSNYASLMAALFDTRKRSTNGSAPWRHVFLPTSAARSCGA